MRPTAVRAAVAVLALAVQLWGLYSPEMPGASAVGSLPGLDKAGHAGMFALVTWALVRLVVPPDNGGPVSGRRRLLGLVLVAATVAHAPLSEMIQGRLLGERAGDPLDVVADLVGVALGLAAAAGERRLRTRRLPTRRMRHGAEPRRDTAAPREDG